MIEPITVAHVTFVSDRSFRDVVRAFEDEVGTLEEIGWPAIPAASRDQDRFRTSNSRSPGTQRLHTFLDN